MVPEDSNLPVFEEKTAIMLSIATVAARFSCPVSRPRTFRNTAVSLFIQCLHSMSKENKPSLQFTSFRKGLYFVCTCSIESMYCDNVYYLQRSALRLEDSYCCSAFFLSRLYFACRDRLFLSFYYNLCF